MTVLVPDPATLGLEAPTLGPWFEPDVTLPAPGDDLGVEVDLTGGTQWRPPAGGLMSLLVVTDPLPPMLAGLRGPAGSPPFTAGRLVAVFRLLPEVEARLGRLLIDVPPADGSAPGVVATRSRVRTFAVELSAALSTLDAIKTMVRPSAAAEANAAGQLGLTNVGGQLGNARTPISALIRPGVFLGASEVILEFAAAATVRLFAFDQRGRAVDPGAVAAWWARLGQSFTNLWAAGVSERTAAVEPQLTVQLVGPDDAPAAAGVLSRLRTQNLTGTGPLRVRGGDAGAATIALTGGTVDDAPIPLAAVLPAGRYAGTAALWPAGAVGGVTRDVVRVALVDVERHLTGQPRTVDGSASAVATERAADQRRTSTRTLVARATVDAADTVLLGTSDDALGALAEVLAAGAAQLVVPVLDRGAGMLTAPSLPAVAPPDALSDGVVTMTALTGGGADAGGTVTQQRVLVAVTLDPALAGAWVRVWPQNFDAETGRHERGAGGGGMVDSAGQARMVVRLADGAVAPANSMGLDVQVVTASAAARYPEVRLERPAPVGGSAVALSAVGADVLGCEPGLDFGGGTVPAGALPSGTTLVELATPPRLVDPSSIPATAWAPGCVGPALAAGDRVLLTEPAWNGWRGGESAAELASNGATVTAISRTGLTRLAEIGAPLPTQARDEVAAAVLTGAGASLQADAVVAAVRPLGAHHELPTHQNGHPGAPADEERHGAGVRLGGLAVTAVAEILRERLSGTTPQLATAATTPLPVSPLPTAPGSWAATLRTVGFGVEAEPFLVELLAATGAAAYPLDGTVDDIRTFLSNAGIPIPSAAGAAAESMLRAINRRLLGARSGYREAATALVDRVAGAQDLIYLETPAFDALTIGAGDDALTWWQRLVDRVTENSALHVLICLPTDLVVGVPRSLQRVRDHDVLAALGLLRAAAGGRLAVFNPVTGPGRALHLDATSVVIDDAFALTGGTHLWRRGLSFDASLAVSVFDERLDDGRPAEVVAFRRALIAGRLGLAPTLLPEDPAEMVRAVQQVSDRGGGLRLSPTVITEPDLPTTATDEDLWNRDGSRTSGFDPMVWLAGLGAAAAAELEAELPGTI